MRRRLGAALSAAAASCAAVRQGAEKGAHLVHGFHLDFAIALATRAADEAIRLRGAGLVAPRAPDAGDGEGDDGALLGNRKLEPVSAEDVIDDGVGSPRALQKR